MPMIESDRGMARDVPIEGDHAHIVPDGQSDEEEIGHLLVRNELRRSEPCGIEEADVFEQTSMGCVLDGGCQKSGRIGHRHRVDVGWMRHDSDEPVLSERTRCPSIPHPRHEQVFGDGMMLM